MASPPVNIPSAPEGGVILERGQTIDRFVVLGLVGRGGMGEVYAAYDPELDRKVAIKLLRARGEAADGRSRLLREAQAIAKLSHPNIVVVYDVGTFGQSVFIAMEFVEGSTVGHWLHAGARPWREVRKVFLAAGRGLAAAHAAGLVHRDFKPDNVMLTKDGQARVMDFGLARQMGDKEEAVRAEMPLPTSGAETIGETFDPSYDPEATINLAKKGGGPSLATSGKYLSVKLTQTGAMLGTPAYMAPEQFAVRPTDARTDQFSFCVALYEGLYGQRPFAGDSFISLMTSVTTGAVGEAPAKTKVPGWMRKVLLRGLQTDPDRRFPSMNALLTALETDPTVRVRRVGMAVGALLCLGALAVGARRMVGSQRALCQGGGQRLAGVWEPRGVASLRKDAIHRSFVATGKSYAEQAFTGATRLLDGYASRWTGMYQDACEATHVRGEQSAEVLDLRMGCLQERLASVRALTDLFVHADEKVVENAVSAAGALPLFDRCADVALLKAVVRPPEDEKLRKRVEALREKQARFAALADAGHCDEAAQMARGLLQDIRATGYMLLLADTLNTAGHLADQCIGSAQGIDWFREAYSAGLASHHDEAAAQAAVLLSGGLGGNNGSASQPEAARQWLAIARAMIARIGGRPLLEAWGLIAEGDILQGEGNLMSAVAVFERSRLAIEKTLGRDHPDVFVAAMNIGNVLQLSGHDAEALTVDTTARKGVSRILGPDHPRVAQFWNNEGEVLNHLHQYSAARVAFQTSLDIWRRSNAEPLYVSYELTGLGLAYLGEGRAAEAVPPLEEALRIRDEARTAPDLLGEVRFGLARALWRRPVGRERARQLAREARADYSRVKTATAQVVEIDAWLRAPS
jgi:tetratricopeptide (TPR) repeat protein